MIKACFILLTSFSSSTDLNNKPVLLSADSFWRVAEAQNGEDHYTVISHTDGMSVSFVLDSVKSIYDQLLNCRR